MTLEMLCPLYCPKFYCPALEFKCKKRQTSTSHETMCKTWFCVIIHVRTGKLSANYNTDLSITRAKYRPLITA